MGVTPGFVCARLDAGQRRCLSAPLFAISGPPPARLVWASGSYSPCLTSTAEDSSSRRRRRAACGISPEDEKQQFAHHEAASHRATKLPSTPCWFLSPHHLDYTSKKTPWGGGDKTARAPCCLLRWWWWKEGATTRGSDRNGDAEPRLKDSRCSTTSTPSPPSTVPRQKKKNHNQRE